jgi:60 kDa SS-A/Ro ribonucleoprotein
MANKTLFQSLRGALVSKTDTVNEAGGRAYALSPKQALAQYAMTGCLNSTYYASADDQLQKVLAMAGQVDAEFVAKTAVYARQKGFMKDMPALLCAALSVKDPQLLRAVFDRVIDDGKMLRNFVQVLRSGVTGRKSLGTVPKKLAQRWLESRTDEQLFCASVGNDPSLADLIKMVHPKPGNATREALYGYLLERKHNVEVLPEIVKQFESFKAGQRSVVPDVPFQMLTALELGKKEWKAIAKNATWHMTRMNLNTFARHDVFDDKSMVKLIAHRLAHADAVKRARVFPYQLLAAFKNAGGDVPNLIRDALQDAMEVATENVPRIDGKVYVLPDVSGSMSSPVTGHRTGATTAVRCIDVAALVAASILRQNPQTDVVPFETDVVNVRLNSRDSVMSNAEKLAAIGGGGTNCSAPLAWLNKKQAKGDLVVFVSDNESWADPKGGRGTKTMQQWSVFKRFNPQARLVCIDIQPHATTQATESADALNIGGFSDQVFEVIAAFAEGRLGADHWVGVIEQVKL